MRSLRLRACALVLVIAASAPALADRKATVFLEDLTSPELAARIESGATTVIVPIGGTEQSGAHIALGKHNVRVRALAERVARVLGNAIVAPVIAYVPEGGVNPRTGHMRYPGTITVPSDAYRKVLASAAQSMKLAGFRDIVFLGDHGDYQRDDQAVAAQLNREWKSSPVRAHAIAEYYRASTAEFAQSLERQGYSAAEIGTHGGVADTSLTLAIDPSLVRSDLLAPSAGVRGDPRRSTAALGSAAADNIVNKTAAAIRAVAHH